MKRESNARECRENPILKKGLDRSGVLKEHARLLACSEVYVKKARFKAALDNVHTAGSLIIEHETILGEEKYLDLEVETAQMEIDINYHKLIFDED